MRIAIVGAGVVGVASAFELASDGHEVTVFEQAGSVATGASFAHAGWLCSAANIDWLSTPRAMSGAGGLKTRWQALRQRWNQEQARAELARRTTLLGVRRLGLARIQALSLALSLDYERSPGATVLLRSERELGRMRGSLRHLAELGVDFKLLDAARTREVEPGLGEHLPLRAAIHLPGDGVGNCRQFVHQLRGAAQRAGAAFRFNDAVAAVHPGPMPRIDSVSGSHAFDTVMLCTGAQAAGLLSPLGLKLPMRSVAGYSVTAPLRHDDTGTDLGPRGVVVDAASGVVMVRLGQRVRAVGSSEAGSGQDKMRPASLAPLYQALEVCFPGATQTTKASQWRGQGALLPDGLPLLGPTPFEGLWLHLVDGADGWSVAPGTARLVADVLAGRTPAVPLEPLSIGRLGAAALR